MSASGDDTLGFHLRERIQVMETADMLLTAKGLL